MIFTNILQGKKYGVVQTLSPISRDFLLLTIQLNCSDRIFPKNSMWKVALVSQNVQNFKKIHRRKRKKIPRSWNFAFLGLCDVIKCQENLTISRERAQITTDHIINARTVIKL